MRTAAVCPTCSTYENALCVIYAGSNLPNLQLPTNSSLEAALVAIDNKIVPEVITGLPAVTYNLGRQILSTTDNSLFFAQDTLGAYQRILSIPSAGVPEYPDNTLALAAGLTPGKLYRTGEFLKIVY